MITKEKLAEWQQQYSKDLNQYKKDEHYLQQLQTGQNRKVRSFFSRLRSKILDFNTEEHVKLNRLLQDAELNSLIEKYPKVLSTYIAYNASFIITLGLCAFAPKKMVSKILSSLIVYGLKTNLGDGFLTYYMVRQIALGGQMTQQEQEIRNIIEFYYTSNRFNGAPMSQEEKEESQELLRLIKGENERFVKFKKVESLV